MKCVPSREKFFQNLEESDSNMKERMRIFLDSMVPLVQEVHEFLVGTFSDALPFFAAALLPSSSSP